MVMGAAQGYGERIWGYLQSGACWSQHLRTDWLLAPVLTGGSALSMALLAPLTVSDSMLSPSSMLESLE